MESGGKVDDTLGDLDDINLGAFIGGDARCDLFQCLR